MARSARLDPGGGPLLRPGWQLILPVNSVLLVLTIPDADDQPAAERLLRPYFGMHQFECQMSRWSFTSATTT